MKKNWISAVLFITWFSAFTQKQDSIFTKKKVSETDVQVLFSYYTQQGIHSAVTGGTGTEKLQVYAPGFTVTQKFDSLNSVNLNAGVDIISSASTDRIDFIRSSASLVDARGYARAGYQRELNKSGYTLGGNLGFSLESDYFSTGAGLLLKHKSKNKSKEWFAELQAFFDDLRWGRVNPNYMKPDRLIYPQELRYREWNDEYKRNSYNLNTGFLNALNTRNSIGIYSGITYQQGLLSTPFHRVYFNDETTLRVENLPSQRIRFPVALQLNSFTGRGWILRSYYRFYYDSFGIAAQTLQFDSPVKINSAFTFSPFVRLYSQTGSKYFKPYMEHDVTQTFYTSDYDLSPFNSIRAGAGFRYAPYFKSHKGLFFNSVDLRYSFYYRSDGLYAHSISFMINYGKTQDVFKKTENN